jgi:iron complex transport system substrate-binding protein
MNQKSPFILLLIITFILIVLGSFTLLPMLKPESASLSPSSPQIQITTASFPRELRDTKGNTLIIPSRPQRIVSQTLATDEILLALSAPERIVALSVLAQDIKYSNIVKQAKQIGGQATDNVEQILNFQPDLIFVASYSRAETVSLLQATGAPVFRFTHFQGLADIKKNIETIGYAIGEEQAADKLIAEMEKDIKAIRAMIPTDSQTKRVMSYSLGYTAGRETTFDDMLKIVGAINVAAEKGITAHTLISDEQILAWQPDVIVTHASVGEFEQVRRELLAHPAIAASQAAQAGQIIIIDNRYFLGVSQYIVKGIKALAEGLYPSVAFQP